LCGVWGAGGGAPAAEEEEEEEDLFVFNDTIEESRAPAALVHLPCQTHYAQDFSEHIRNTLGTHNTFTMSNSLCTGLFRSREPSDSARRVLVP